MRHDLPPKETSEVVGILARDVAVVVPVKVMAAEVVRHIKVHPAVVVEIFPRGGEAEPAVVHIEAGGFGHVGEMKIAVISEERVAAAVVRVVIRDGRENTLDA